MNANELRIGNYVYFTFTKEVVKILGINAYENNGKIEYSISFMNGLNLYCEQLEKLKAIDLCQEQLIDFGWETNYEKYDIICFINKKLDIDNINYIKNKKQFYWNCWENTKEIKYVHELQNLYFALTGEELVLSDVVS